MPKFTIELYIQKNIEVVVESDDMKDAIIKAKKGHEDYRVESVNDKMFIGECVFSEKLIFEDDDYVCDDEGEYALISELPSSESKKITG